MTLAGGARLESVTRRVGMAIRHPDLPGHACLDPLRRPDRRQVR
jgi:hypothetical protein